jgi:hypothetical protein
MNRKHQSTLQNDLNFEYGGIIIKHTTIKKNWHPNVHKNGSLKYMQSNLLSTVVSLHCI